jgi:hypothetical protein
MEMPGSSLRVRLCIWPTLGFKASGGGEPVGSSFGGANIKGVYLKAMFLQFLLIAFGVLVSQGRSQL